MNNEMEQLLMEEENRFKNIGIGSIVKGTIILEKEDEYYVDLNYKTDGVLPKNEAIAQEEIKEGEEVILKVIKIDRNSGELVLSQKKAEEITIWNKLNVGQMLEVKIIEKNDKGLIGEYKTNIRGFIPLSHVDIKYVDRDMLEAYKGKKIKVEIIDVVSEKKRLVLSIKNVLLKEKETKKIDFMNKLKDEEVYEGIVKDIKEYGMFVDLGGLTGLVHRSQISWDKNIDLSKVYKIGDCVKVQVLSFDREKERLSLSIKSLQKNPWDEFIEKYRVEDVVEGIVKNIKDYGVFIRIDNVVDGFVHISNMSYEFVKSPKDLVKLGDKVSVKIISIDMEHKKVELTMSMNEEEGCI